MTTIGYWADDVSPRATGTASCSGIDAYVQRPDTEHAAYVEFRVGDHEHDLGIVACGD